MTSIVQRMMIAVLTVTSAAGQVVINEVYAHDAEGDFLAANGGRYDWIELHNRGAAEVDLVGHFLTDRSSDPSRWQFTRSFIIPAGGHRVVFASDLNALVMGQEHLNFKLSSSGEYLGLIAPDGVTILDQFAPSYPETDNRVTFGRPEDNGEPTLLIEPTPGRTNSAAPILPSVLRFELTPNPAVRGSIVTARWETQNAESTRLGTSTLFPGETAPNLLKSGSLQFRAHDSTTYSLAAVSRYATDSSEIDLEVLESPLPFQATPSTLATGGMTLLRWTPQFFDDPIDVALNGETLRTRNGRIVYFPTNEVVMTAAGTWKKAPEVPDPEWKSPEFDDRDWTNLASLNEAGFYRREFDLLDPQELTTILLDQKDSNSAPRLTLWINGQELSRIPDLGGARFRVKPGILRATGNVLAVLASYLPPESNLTLELVAWRPQDTETIYPLNLTRLVGGIEKTETIDLTILSKNAELPQLPPIAISEFYGGDFGEDPGTYGSFIELTNRGDEAVDLRGMQLAGMLYQDFTEAAEPLLQPGKFGLVPWNPFAINEWYGSGRPIIGVSEGPPAIRYELPNGNPIILIDEYGRLIEMSPPLDYGFDFVIGAERLNFDSSADDRESWDHDSFWRGTPGEDRLEIEEFTVSPNVAQRGDLVTLSWRTSRPVDLEISNGVGKVSGAEGSVEVRLPEDRDYISYRLTASGDFLVREKHISVTTPPVIRYFQSNIRVIEPYQPVTIRWGWLLRNETLEPDPGLLPYSSNNEFELITGAGGFGRGQRWSYLPADREFQPTWNEIERPPGNWSAAETPLGVNRPGVRRVLPPNNPESTASYFRREFELKNIAEIERVVIDLLAEDGAVIYLNGNEALRINMPDGEVTQALSDRSTGDLLYEEFEIDRSLLVEGENVLAVSLHLFHEGGALPVDQAFDLALRAERPIPEDGRLHYTLSSENAAGRDEATLTLIIGETTTLEDWQLAWDLQGEASLSDTDGDGLTDLLEFVTGSNPTFKSPQPLWVERTADGFFDINYQQELAAIGYQLFIESSDDLEEWQEINNRGGYSYEDDEIPANSTLATRKYRTLGTTPGARKYYRLRVVPN